MFKSTFTNELGNTIAITVARTDAGRIRVVMTGRRARATTPTRARKPCSCSRAFAAV